MPTRTRLEPAESVRLPVLLLPPHLPIQASTRTLITPRSYLKEVEKTEIGDSSNRFLSSHPAHIKGNQKGGGAAHKTNQHLTIAVKESASWLCMWGDAEEVLINIGKISESINEMKWDMSCRRRAQVSDAGAPATCSHG